MRLKSCLVYLMSVGGAHYKVAPFLVMDKIKTFLPNQYQNYMTQIDPARIGGLDAVGVIDLVFSHLALYDLNRSF